MGAKLRWYLVGAGAAIVLLAIWWGRSGASSVSIDLVDQLPRAVVHRPSIETFRVDSVSIAGESQRSILASAQSRLAYRPTIPANGWFQVSFGVREEAWSRQGTGVLFMVGVSHRGAYQELLSLTVDPQANESDRRWIPVLLDLAPWGGQEIELVLNTRVASEAAPPDSHFPAWGAPAIITR